jgi:hypothetical protein
VTPHWALDSRLTSRRTGRSTISGRTTPAAVISCTINRIGSTLVPRWGEPANADSSSPWAIAAMPVNATITVISNGAKPSRTAAVGPPWRASTNPVSTSACRTVSPVSTIAFDAT